jgi:hypothetical protein
MAIVVSSGYGSEARGGSRGGEHCTQPSGPSSHGAHRGPPPGDRGREESPCPFDSCPKSGNGTPKSLRLGPHLWCWICSRSQEKASKNLRAPVTCVIGRSLLCELLHLRTVGQHDGRIQMGKTGLFAASAAALILACVAGWAASGTQTRVASPTTGQIDPFEVMTSAKQLPTEHFADYSFVF